MPDFLYMLETRLTPEQQAGLRLVQQVARDHQMNVYLTGGSVRDLLTGFQVRDLDFSVQGNALKLQKDLEKAGAQLQGMNEDLRTLYMLLPGRVRAEIAATRSETFEKPSKPTIQTPVTIYEDLRRRDFAANAMALSLNPGSYGLFMDPVNGVADIEAKQLRIIHNYSFYEEPSRMVRATRFLARFGWTMEERTLARYAAAKENDYISHINKAAIGYELEQVLHEPDPLSVMRALEAEGYLKLLYPGWTPGKVDEQGLRRVEDIRMRLAGLGLTADPSTANAEYLTKKMPEKDVAAMQKMMPRKGFVDAWRAQEDEAKELAKRLTSKEADTPSHTWQLLMSAKPEATLYLSVTTKQAAVEKKLTDFFTTWPAYRQKIPYAIMTELRITQELPVYQKLLDEMFLLMIDGKLKTEEEIRAFLQPHSPPLPAPPPSYGRRGRAKKATKAAKTPAKAAAKAEGAAAKSGALAAVATAVGKAAGAVAKAVAGAGDKAKAVKHDGKPEVKPAAKQSAPTRSAAKAKPNEKPRKVDISSKLKRKPAPKKAKAVAKAKPKAAKAKSKAAVKRSEKSVKKVAKKR